MYCKIFTEIPMSMTHRAEENRLHEPRVNVEFSFRPFEKIAPHFYNELPDAVKNSGNLETLKKDPKTHLFTLVLVPS